MRTVNLVAWCVNFFRRFAINRTIIIFLLLYFSDAVVAQDSPFHSGPLITDYGSIATIEDHLPIPDGTVMQVSFDIATQAEQGKINRNFESVARFLNMHVAAGLAVEDMQLAIVVHGSASKDLLSAKAYQARYGVASANTGLLRELAKHNVDIIICGQSAAYHEISTADLAPSVEVALSAMTAHALLQQAGYSINPF